MRWLAVLFFVLASTLVVSAEDWTTADGNVYKNVTVVAQEDDGVRITYDGGAGKIPYYELPLDLQKRFGQDAASLEAKRKAAEKALEDATRNADAAAAAAAADAQKKQQEAAAAAAQAAAKAAANRPAGMQLPPAPVPHPLPPPPSAYPPVSPTAISKAVQLEAKPLYPGSIFSYDDGLDICYLDSPAVNVMLVLPDASPIAASPVGTLTLRIATDGRKPEAPDRVEATFVPSGAVKNSGDDQHIKFLVDGTYVPVTDLVTDDSGQAHDLVSFYLTSEQANSIFKAKNVNFSVGSINYMIDQNGIATFRKYFDDIDHLPAPTATFSRSFHKFLNRLPSIITVISTVCEYIILGSFAIVVAASIAAFIMGVTRFIKM